MASVAPGDGSVWVQTAAGGTNEVLDGSTPAVRGSQKLGKVPVAVAWTPDGRYAYVTVTGENKVAVIDTARMEVVKELPTGKQPWGLVIMPSPQAGPGM